MPTPGSGHPGATLSESDAAVLDILERLALADRRKAIDEALDAARETLGMEIAYFSEFALGEQLIKDVRGDGSAIGVAPGNAYPLEDTYCRRMLSGELSNVVTDARNDPRVSDLSGDEESPIGSYIGVPLQLSDGSIYGTLCCASSRANSRLGAREVQFMRVLGRMLADELEREEDDAARSSAQEDVEGALLKLDLWFMAAPHAAAAARSALEVLADHVEAGCLQDARLLVTELVTNSVRHAGLGRESAVGLALLLTPGALTVAVTDPGPGFRPEIATPDLDQEGGRGLFIVEQLADRWGVGDSPLEPPGGNGREETGTVVWFELRPGPDAGP